MGSDRAPVPPSGPAEGDPGARLLLAAAARLCSRLSHRGEPPGTGSAAEPRALPAAGCGPAARRGPRLHPEQPWVAAPKGAPPAPPVPARYSSRSPSPGGRWRGGRTGESPRGEREAGGSGRPEATGMAARAAGAVGEAVREGGGRVSQAAPSAAWRGLPKGSGWAMTHPQPEGAAGVLGFSSSRDSSSAAARGPRLAGVGRGLQQGPRWCRRWWGCHRGVSPQPGIDPGRQGRGRRASTVFIRGDGEMAVAMGHPSPRRMGPVGAGTGTGGPPPCSVPLQGSLDPPTSCCSQRGGSWPPGQRDSFLT